MGWKHAGIKNRRGFAMSQSAFAGYGLEESQLPTHNPTTYSRNPLSLDMGWKTSKNTKQTSNLLKSQSAFAGYGLEVIEFEK